MNKRLYAIHRWLSAFALLQFTVWALSGLFFAVVPISRVRGGSVEGAHDAPMPDALGIVSPATILAQAAQAGLSGVYAVELRAAPSGELWYIVRRGHAAVRFDARTGALAPVTATEAEAIARRDQASQPAVASSAFVTEPAIEYRDKPVPAWRVVLRDVVLVSESGIHTPEDARRMRDAGADAILVGEVLMRSPDPAARIRELIGIPA